MVWECFCDCHQSPLVNGSSCRCGKETQAGKTLRKHSVEGQKCHHKTNSNQVFILCSASCKKEKKSFNSQFVSCNPGKKLQFFLRWRPSSFHPHIVCYRKLVSQTSLVVERNGPETKRNLDLEEKTGRGKVWGQVLTFEPLILHRLSLITHWITCLVLRLLLDLCKDLSCVWVNLFNFRFLVLQLDHSNRTEHCAIL